MMIPGDAKICPHCRKKQGTSPVVKLLLAVAGLGILANVAIGNKTSNILPPSFDSYREKAQQRKAELDNVQLTAKGKKVKSKHADWTNDDCNIIAGHKIHIGMTDMQVRAAWGKPHKINSTTYGNGVEHEQWVMHEMGSGYLYFDNGVLTAMQQSK